MNTKDIQKFIAINQDLNYMALLHAFHSCHSDALDIGEYAKPTIDHWLADTAQESTEWFWSSPYVFLSVVETLKSYSWSYWAYETDEEILDAVATAAGISKELLTYILNSVEVK